MLRKRVQDLSNHKSCTRLQSISYLIGPATVTAPATPIRAAPPLFSRPGLVDGERPAIDLLAIEGGHGRSRLFPIVHLDKAEAFRAARVPELVIIVCHARYWVLCPKALVESRCKRCAVPLEEEFWLLSLPCRLRA